MTKIAGISCVETLAQIDSLLQAEKEVFIVYDVNVAWVADEITSHAAVVRQIPIETSEELKSMDSVLGICRALLEAGATRNALILAVGGGITTDMAGFAASIYKRGIRYANIPTTLLAQVDAAIGGKTGVNLDGYKNMIGCFRMPEFTLLCAGTLSTLPAHEFRCGLAEMLKTFLIADAASYAALLSENPAPGTFKDSFGKLILRAAEIKAVIVGRDPYEKGERALLNLGHTFGHAIEHCSAGKISHGDAVAEGIILAARLSDALQISSSPLEGRLRADFAALGLPVECQFSMAQLSDAMAKDKKATGSKVKFILLEAPGKPVMKELTVQEAIEAIK